MYACVVVAVAVAAYGCSGVSDPSAPSGDDVQIAEYRLVEAYEDFLLTEQPTGKTAAEWDEFVSGTTASLEELRRAHTKYSRTFDEALDAGNLSSYEPLDSVAEFIDRFGVWIEDQEEQARLTLACLNLSDQEAEADCVVRMFLENEDRWNADAAAANAAVAAMNAAQP